MAETLKSTQTRDTVSGSWFSDSRIGPAWNQILTIG